MITYLYNSDCSHVGRGAREAAGLFHGNACYSTSIKDSCIIAARFTFLQTAGFVSYYYYYMYIWTLLQYLWDCNKIVLI